MNLNERKQAFITLGTVLRQYIGGSGDFSAASLLSNAIKQAYIDNNWFTEANVRKAISAIADNMLCANKLDAWLANYPDLADNSGIGKKIGIIMAGNIPLVGFHDLLCVLLCGCRAVIKTSSKDNALMRTITDILCKIEPQFEKHITYTPQQPANVDAVISTGSNNSARYFESWYGNIPHIIRKNRSSIAILTGKESDIDLQALGKDIFSYFGLGCRNVSSLFVPENYNFEKLIKALSEYSLVAEHKDYKDCYIYQKAISEMNNDTYKDTGFLILKPDFSLSAPIALLNCQKYINLDFVKELISLHQDKLQCVAYQYNDIEGAVKFGQTQQPQLYDYADGIDTIEFILSVLNNNMEK